LSLPTCGPAASGGPRPLVELAVRAEERGIDAVAVPDHIAFGPDTAGYPFGSFPLPPDAPFLEPLSVLMAIAAVTRDLRLTTGILIAPLRRAAVLAKTVATLDVMSGGRVELGVGVGWHEAEYLACGVEYHRRGAVLDDVIGACRALWQQADVTFSSETVNFASLSSLPLPVQQPLPVLIAGSLHARNVRRILATGDGWIPVMGASPVIVAEGIALLRAAGIEQGRDLSGLLVRSELAPRFDDRGRPDLDATLEPVAALIAAGVTDVQFPLPYFVSDITRADDVVDRLVAGWRRCVA
jgi:probable F420-dependent oxidoreductase